MDGSLADPVVTFRWAIGGVLACLLVVFHRMGAPLLQGRRALVVWVLVALLHVSAARTLTVSLINVTPEDAAAVLVVLPAAAPVLLGAMLLVVMALVSATTSAPDLRQAWLAHDADARLAANPLVPLLPPRAPPRCPLMCPAGMCCLLRTTVNGPRVPRTAAQPVLAHGNSRGPTTRLDGAWRGCE